MHQELFNLRSSPRRPQRHIVQTFPVRCNTWMSLGHHKSGLHAHSAITNDRGSRVGRRTVACTSAQAASRPGMLFEMALFFLSLSSSSCPFNML
jgi:hypothetical protein